MEYSSDLNEIFLKTSEILLAVKPEPENGLPIKRA